MRVSYSLTRRKQVIFLSWIPETSLRTINLLEKLDRKRFQFRTFCIEGSLYGESIPSTTLNENFTKTRNLHFNSYKCVQVPMYFQINTHFWEGLLKDAFLIRQTPFDSSLRSGLQSLNINLRELYFPYQMFITHSEVDKGHHIYTKAERVFLADELQVDDFCRTLKIHQSRVSVIGSPQLDLIIETNQRRDKIVKVGYAPHHSIEKSNHLGGFGNFLTTSTAILRASDEFDIEFIVRPHPIFKLVSATNAERESQWQFFLAEIESRSNISIDANVDSSAFFQEIDLLITDGVSFLAEFPITGKPLYFWPYSDQNELSDFGKLFYNEVTKVLSSEDLLKRLGVAINSEDGTSFTSPTYGLDNLGKTAKNLENFLNDIP